MLKFRTVVVTVSLAAVALLIPATAQADNGARDAKVTVVSKIAGWRP